jgi:hypothetical protein
MLALHSMRRHTYRVRRWIAALEGMNMAKYRVAVHELKVHLDLLERARRYIVNVSSKIKG